MEKPKFLANDKLHNSALVTTALLGIISLIAHVNKMNVPYLDQAFIAAIGILLAPKGDKEAKHHDAEA